jgi:uncharacterized SAM-binding protein YcdF (DUF218 family)
MPRVGRLLHWGALAGVGLCLVALAGLVRFAIPPAAENQPAATDAIVVLTGGSLRLPSAIDLLREGKGRVLFVTGVPRQVDLGELLRGAGTDTPRWLACCIVIGHEARNTMGNAVETARWMRREGYHSLRLVTSWYHMPRSLLEFARAMPNVEIVPHPVFSAHVKQQNWWAWRGTATLLIGEYGKYLAALFLPVVERPSVSAAADSPETEARR